MKKILRLIFNALAALSMMLAAASCVLWIRSYTSSDQLRWINASGSRSLFSANGNLVLLLSLEDWSRSPEVFGGPAYTHESARNPFDWLTAMGIPTWKSTVRFSGLGFKWHSARNPETGDFYAFALAPFRSLTALTTALPLIWTIAHLRQRIRATRKTQGRCPT